MKPRLVTNEEVVALAFADGEYIPPTAVADADIAAAEERYLIPVIGRTLYEAVAGGAYAELREEYAAPTVALFTRCMMQPALDVRTCSFGTTVPKSSSFGAAAGEQLHTLRRTIRAKARTLLRRMSDHLEAHADDYPEYRSEDNILNRCMTDGNIIQIR